MKHLITLSLILSLASCATSGVAISCLSLRPYSDVEMNNLEAEIEALPADSELITAMIDYERLRAETRACQGAQ